MLTDLLRAGARDLIAQAVEAELQALLEQHAQRKLPDGRQAVVRNSFLPERTIQTGIGDVEIKVPKVRDKSDSGLCFNSSLLPPYLKCSSSIEELLPWLYLRGISTGDYQEAQGALLGEQARGVVGQHHQPPERHCSSINSRSCERCSSLSPAERPGGRTVSRPASL